MSKTFRPWEVNQRLLLPPSVKELVPEGHLAHFVRDTVREDLDLGGILGCYEEERGYPPYHPVMMVALLLYGYCQGVYSSRRLARGCEERVDFMAVTGMQKPDFRTISEFRKRHLEALKGLFVQVLGLCREAGLVKLGHVALDGTKVKANASKHKAMSYERMLKAERELKAEVEGWLREAAARDEEEDQEHGKDRRGDELPDWVKDKGKRLAKIQEAKKALEEQARSRNEEKSDKNGGKPGGKEQRNFTDPESRIMRKGTDFVQGYNCQAAVDADSQVIVAEAVTNQGTDVGQLKPMVKQIRTNTGRQAKELSADAGYASEENLKELAHRGIQGYVATGRQRHGQASAVGDGHRPKGRWTARMRRKLLCGGRRSRYRLRKQVVEPVFGQIKAARGFGQFLLRGLDKVRGEWNLLCVAHNLLKLAATRA